MIFLILSVVRGIMDIQQRFFRIVTRTNWILFVVTSLIGWVATPPLFAKGIMFGGLIVTVSFHLLHRSLKKAFRQPRSVSFPMVMVRYNIRLVVVMIIIFLLISRRIVDPIGLLIGLSVVVASIMMTTVLEARRLWASDDKNE